MPDEKENKRPSTTSNHTKSSISEDKPKKLFTLVKITGKETDEELDVLAQQMYDAVMK